MKKVAVLVLVLLLVITSGSSQEKERPKDEHASTCPLNCNVCRSAIEKALDFLASVQDEKGGWDIKLRKPQKDEKKKADKRWANNPVGSVAMPYDAALDASIAITSLAGLAFLAQGSDTQQGRYKENIQKALKFILEQEQSKDGALSAGGFGRHFSEETALAVIFLSEIYIRNQDERVKDKIEKAVRYLTHIQVNNGGWSYGLKTVHMNDNVGATYTILASLLSAREAGIDIKGEIFSSAIKYLKSQIEKNGMVSYSRWFERFTQGYYTHIPGLDSARPGGTLYVLYRLGQASDEKVKKVKEYFLKRKESIIKEVIKNNAPEFTHALLFAALGMFQLGEEEWQSYYGMLRDKLLKARNEDGSWGPDKDFLLAPSPGLGKGTGPQHKGGLMQASGPKSYETARFLIQLQLPLGNLKTLSQRKREY